VGKYHFNGVEIFFTAESEKHKVVVFDFREKPGRGRQNQ